MKPTTVISTILKHDNKQTSYKIALLRAINDVALAFPDIRNFNQDVAVPLRVLAEFWLAYYWPFANPENPILQGGQRMIDGIVVQNDMAFRVETEKFRLELEQRLGTLSKPCDGFYIVNELRIPRKRKQQVALLPAYEQAIKKISHTIGGMPVRHAGPGEYSVFKKPEKYSLLKTQGQVMPIPGTREDDRCIIIRADLWQAFQEMSLYIEALCIHEWCLFTEGVSRKSDQPITRGEIYQLLTSRPDNRRPLTWECAFW
jgi:hypothetical protein